MKKDLPQPMPQQDNPDQNPSSDQKPSSKKQPAKILPVEPSKVTYEFTCPRCGSHLSTESVVSVAKLGGTGIGFAKVKVCRICGFAKEYHF